LTEIEAGFRQGILSM